MVRKTRGVRPQHVVVHAEHMNQLTLFTFKSDCICNGAEVMLKRVDTGRTRIERGVCDIFLVEVGSEVAC